jgi:glucosamine-6-phosphate deaminase
VTTKLVNGIELRVASDYQDMSRIAADVIVDRVTARPSLNILAPTGTTPAGVYDLIAKSPERFTDANIFNMDEYCEKRAGNSYSFLLPSDQRSYQFYMRQHVFKFLDESKSYFPGISNVAHPGAYDELIADNGGLDLCLNAIGEDGHTFGFNFPGSSFDSVTRLVCLNTSTKEVNKELTGMETPQYAVTVGLKTGMRAREVLVLVSGLRKADILRRVLLDEISEDVPATILKRHKNCVWIVDEDAASKL